MKTQRKTNNLGLNTATSRDESYAVIETRTPMARCSDSKHTGERMLPVRSFYLDKGGKAIQGACITCQKNRRRNRIQRSRDKFVGKSKQEIYELYATTYGPTKTCSKCSLSKPPSGFPLSLSMETGLHNMCIPCSTGNSQGNSGLRDFIFMPDKDGIRYKKKDRCERCRGTHKLAVDHIMPIAKGGSDCITNKQTLCSSCNSTKSDTIWSATPGLLSSRYQDVSLDCKDLTSLSQVLSKKVCEFKEKNFLSASLEDIRSSTKEYIKKHNLGHDLDRIVHKLAVLFHKL